MVLHHEEIGMFMPLNRVLLRRYMTLTAKALVIYKDQATFVSHPNKAWMIIPLSEITEMKLNKATDRRELNLEMESVADEVKQASNPLGSNVAPIEQMYVLEVRLSNTYSKIAELINNFNWQPLKEFSGRKKQAC